MIHTEHNGLGGGTSVKQTLVSPMHTIDVIETSTGHEIDVDNSIIETINNKQDKIIVGGMQTNAVCSMSFLERNDGGENSIPRDLNHYIPLLEVQSINNSKSQFEFSIFSREDGMEYYGRYLFTSHGTKVKFELLDYSLNQEFITSPNSFSPTNIVAFKIYESSTYARFLICKKIISTVGQLDAFFFNILAQDIGFCYSKKYYSRNPQIYFAPQEFIHVNQNYLNWDWYWNNSCDSLEKEYAIQGQSQYLHSVVLNNCTMYVPTPAIIKTLTFNEYTQQQLDFKGIEAAKVNTLDYWIDGINGLNPNFNDRYRTIQLECEIMTGTEMSQYTWDKFAFVNFSVFDNNKCYFVFRTLRSGLTQFGFIIETPTPDNY